MLKFEVGKNDAGMRMDKLLQKLMPTLPKSLMYKYIRMKKIKLNGKRTDIAYKPLVGDIIEAYISDEFAKKNEPKYDFLTASDKLDIVYEDENILLVDKKQGVLVHPDKNEYRDTLISRICHYLYKKGEYDPASENSFTPALANRIDRNTGGIVIAAKNAAALKILCDKIKYRELDKRYLAVVHGILKQKQALLEGYLYKNEDKNQVYLQNRKTDDNKTVKTKYKVLKEDGRLSLIEVELITGRTHQIRAHLASIGHPLLGDGKYGRLRDDKKLGFNKQALYSYKLTFDFKTDAGILNYLNGKTFSVDNVWFAKELFDYDV
ncbi:MAG: RluA family pseudouridine synthase [Clostridia bacterium]|nr:RluA family pseudouridine synthase [Clostridia bacterium]